jgi:NitT/TauT family transport system permease protein
MKADIASGSDRITHGSIQKAVSPAARRWRRIRLAAIVLATQLALLIVLLGLWEQMTANNKQAAFMFGSPSAMAGFLSQMAEDGSLWRDIYVTGLETLLGFLIGNFIGTVVGLSLW